MRDSLDSWAFSKNIGCLGPWENLDIGRTVYHKQEVWESQQQVNGMREERKLPSWQCTTKDRCSSNPSAKDPRNTTPGFPSKSTNELQLRANPHVQVPSLPHWAAKTGKYPPAPCSFSHGKSLEGCQETFLPCGSIPSPFWISFIFKRPFPITAVQCGQPCPKSCSLVLTIEAPTGLLFFKTTGHF